VPWTPTIVDTVCELGRFRSNRKSIVNNSLNIAGVVLFFYGWASLKVFYLFKWFLLEQNIS